MTVLRRIEGIPGTHSRHRGHTRSTASIGRMNRPLTILTATALGLSLSLVPVTPAVADGPSTTDVELVADPWPGAPPWAPGPWGTPRRPTTSTLDTSVATADQSAGLVTIASEVNFGQGEAAGTGMVVDGEGIVVTNHHVVEHATDLEVTIPDTGETYRAEVVGSDARRDVAVLQLGGASGLQTVELADSPVEAGDSVTAVGDAGGDGGTLTSASGTVTDERTSITVTDEQTGQRSRLRRLIEVDADVVSGDSGGALTNDSGQVVGMTVAASSGGADIAGYAIPIVRVLRVLDQVLSGDAAGGVSIGYDAFLGVTMGTGLQLVDVVDGSAAESAGLSAGDTLTALGSRRVSTQAELRRAVTSHSPGEEVTVSWQGADGSAHSATVTLGRAPVA